MTIEEYLVDTKEIYYQMSGKVDGGQIFISSRVHRLTDIRGSNGVLSTIRFIASMGSILSLPAATKVDEVYPSRAVITLGSMRLVIWPLSEGAK